MTAPADNTLAMKFKTPEEREALCQAYIAHVESGLSDECFPECDPQTFRRYLRDFPDDFDTDLIQKARRKRQLFWEDMGRTGSMGAIKGFNALSWRFNMGNRFGWHEKKEETLTVKQYGAAALAQAVLNPAEAETPCEDEQEE